MVFVALKYSEEVVRSWHENTYKWTDDYIGRFLPYMDKGWTILLVSDHALICPEAEPNEICDNSGVNIGVMNLSNTQRGYQQSLLSLSLALLAHIRT